MKDRVANSVFWIAWSRGAVQTISFVTTLVVARLLVPADYGLFALAAIFINTIALLADLGMGAAIVQFQDLEARELNAFFWVNVAVALVGYAGLFVAAPAIERWFATPELATVIRFFGWALPLAALRIVPENLLRRELQLDKISQAEIFASFSTLPIVLGMAYAGFGVWALVASGLVPHVTQGVICFWFAGWRPGFVVGSRRLGAILSYSAATVGSSLLWSLLEQADAAVLGKTTGTASVGVYSMAKQLAILPVTKIALVVNQLSSVVMARLQTDRIAMCASFRRALRLVACLTMPVCVGLAVVADDVVRIALGPKWMDAAPLLHLLAMFAAVRALGVLVPAVLMATYRATFLMLWTVVSLIVMSFGFWLGSRYAGPAGVALAWLILYPILLAWLTLSALEEIRLPWRDVLKELALPALATLAMFATTEIVRFVCPGMETRDILLRLAGSVLAGGAVYGWVVLQGSILRAELIEVARWLVRPGVSAPT